MSDHPARVAAQRSMEAVHRKDREAWLANFADDAVLEDPIGPSPFSPDGRGHAGRAAIAGFWDRYIAPHRVLFHIRESYACGAECANVGSIAVVMVGGAVAITQGVFTYRVNDAGLVTALRAYWELDRQIVFGPP